MKRLILLAALLLVVVQSLQAQQTITDSLLSGGIMRHYHIYLPKNHEPGSSVPLIIHLHGYGSNGTLEQGYTKYMPIADTAGFLIVYPEGVLDANSHQYWNAGLPTFPTVPDDVTFISELIDALHIRYNVNRQKVYASGLSNGGYMCYQLAWKLSDKISAIASVSGSMAPLEFAKCKPVNAVPVMEIHGTADNVVPYTQSAGTTDIDTLLHFWVVADGCIPLPGITNLPDSDPLDGTTVIHYEWSAELRNTSSELYKIIGGAHINWPGAGAGNNGDFSASTAIWNFFNRFQNSFASVKNTEDASSFSFYPNPASGLIHISNPFEGIATITDISGRKVASSKERIIDISSLPSGCYVLQYESNGKREIKKLVKY